MADITDIPTAMNVLRAFVSDPPASTPDKLREELNNAVQQFSPVDAIVGATEAMFAHLGDLTNAGKQLLAGLAGVATTMGWHGLAGPEGRGIGIVKAARREAGEESPLGSWPDPADDPKPLERYVTPAPLPIPAVPEVEGEE